MRMTEVVLALVLGATTTGPATSGGSATDHSSIHNDKAAGAPPAGSIAARLWARPSTETILRQEVTMLEKQREVLRLSVEELKLTHERSARVKAIGIAQDMIQQRGAQLRSKLHDSLRISQPPPAPKQQQQQQQQQQDSLDPQQRSTSSQLLARSVPPPQAVDSASIPAAVKKWCEQAATVFSMTSPVAQHDGTAARWGAMKDQVYQSAWTSNNCDLVVFAQSTASSVAAVSAASAGAAFPMGELSSRAVSISSALPSSSSSFMYLKKPGAAPRRRVTVVVWNKIRGFLDWLRPDFVKDARSKCSTECIFTDSKSSMSQAQGVLFHAKTHSMADFPRSKANPSQKYMMVSLEQPAYAPLMKKQAYLNKFDYLMTYDLDTSAVPIITIHPHYSAREYFDAKPVPWHKKKDAAVMFTSNCKNAGAENRLRYYQELMKHMEVHSYGKCLHNRDEPDPQGRNRNENKRHILSQYKWYLAFENNIIKDYVSEKVFDGILAGTVPVYYGTDTVDRLMPAPGKTLVKVSDFGSPAELAAHLRALGADQAKYEALLAWKEYPPQSLVDKFQEVIDSTGYKYTSLCRICHRLASDIPEGG